MRRLADYLHPEQQQQLFPGLLCIATASGELAPGRRARLLAKLGVYKKRRGERQSTGRPGSNMLGRLGLLISSSWSESEGSVVQPTRQNPRRRGRRQVGQGEPARVRIG